MDRCGAGGVSEDHLNSVCSADHREKQTAEELMVTELSVEENYNSTQLNSIT